MLELYQVFGRYAMGWWPSKLVVLLNIIQMIGYCLIDCVVGGQILSAVSPNSSMSVAVGKLRKPQNPPIVL
jgi:purine-cytosine permease-like protein